MAEEKARRFGRYVIVEHTARRLEAEARGRPLVALGAVWGGLSLIVASIAPWQGGVRLYIAIAAAVIAAAISFLVLRFVPRRERLTVDVEVGEVRGEREYLLPRQVRGVHVPLTVVKEVRCRRQRWRDGPGAEATRWVMELIGEEGAVWQLALDRQEEPICELARLMAEVAGRPFSKAPAPS